MANAEQFGILSIVTALAVRFLFYEDWEENYRIRKTYMEELERASEMSESDFQRSVESHGQLAEGCR